MTDPKFMTPPHRRAYLTHLNRCKVMDSYPEYTRQLDDVVIDDARNKSKAQAACAQNTYAGQGAR